LIIKFLERIGGKAMSSLDRVAITTNEIHPVFEEAVKIGMGWGIRNFELKDVWGRSTRIPRLTSDQERAIYETFESNGLVCVALSPGIFINSYSPEVYQEEICLLERCFTMAERLNTNLIIVFSFNRGEAGPEAIMPSEEVNALREAARRAADRGMILALENMQTQWADTAENSRKILELVDYPAFRLNWDPANAVMAGDLSPFPKGYEAVKEFMVHFHLKNIIRSGGKEEWSVLSKGEINYTVHLQKVVQDGYQGWFIIETHYEPLEANSKINFNYLQQVFSAKETDL